MWLHKKRGFALILIAVGLISVLGISSLVLQGFSLMRARKLVAHIQRQEAFTVGELTAWHNYYRNKQGLTPPQLADEKGRNVITLLGTTGSELSPNDTNLNMPGTPLNLATTSEFDIGPLHYTYTDPNQMYYRQPASGSQVFCGVSSFSSSKISFKNCLSAKSSKISPPSSPRGPRLLALNNTTACAIVTGGAVMCWGSGPSLGIGKTDEFPLARYVPFPNLITQNAHWITGGSYMMCAALTDHVKCWGQNWNPSPPSGGGNEPIWEPTEIEGTRGAVSGLAVGQGYFNQNASGLVNHACAIIDTEVRCWGTSRQYFANGSWNDNFNEKDADKLRAFPVPGLPNGATWISAGSHHTCAIVKGEVWCWGEGGTEGQLGDNVQPGFRLAKVQGLTDPVEILASGRTSTCALSAGKLKCWGKAHLCPDVISTAFVGGGRNCQRDVIWQDSATATTPEVSKDLTTTIDDIWAYGQSYCISTEGKIACWGSHHGLGKWYQISKQPGVLIYMPSLPDSYIQLAISSIGGGSGTNTQCILTQDRRLFCNGLSSLTANGTQQSEISLPSRSPYSDLAYQEDIPLGKTLAKISHVWAGGVHSCAQSISKDLYCWGNNESGALGPVGPNPTQQKGHIPIKVPGLSEVEALTLGYSHSCAIVKGGARCWGANEQGQLGNGSTQNSSETVTPVGLTSGVTVVSAAQEITCAVVSGNIYCWGNGYSTTPTLISNISNATAVAAQSFRDGGGGYHYHVCALAGGSVQCWGENDVGQLGQDTGKVPSAVPLTVAGLPTPVTEIGIGESISCALANNKVYCWGSNQYGLLGDSNLSSGPTPQLVSGNRVVDRLSIHKKNALLVSVGHVFCWGDGRFPVGAGGGGSPCGLNEGAPERIFTPIEPHFWPTLPQKVSDIASGYQHSCIVSDEKVYCWGENSNAQVGIRPGIGWTAYVPILVGITQ